MTRVNFWLVILMSMYIPSRGEAEQPTPSIQLAPKQAAVFPGQVVTRTIQIDLASRESRIAWRFSVGPRTVSRREQAVPWQQGSPAEVEIELSMPPLRDSVALTAELQVDLISATGESLAQARQTFWVLAEDPFADRTRWLEGMKMLLYDPIGDTGDRFDAAGIPYRFVRTLSALRAASDGCVVIGEDVSFANQPGLFPALVQLAADGRRVLVFAPKDGKFQLPKRETKSSAATSVILHGPEVIGKLDKRLDTNLTADDEPPQGSAWRLAASHGKVVLQTGAMDSGWPWVEFRYSNGGRLILCGFPIINSWDVGPTPRYLLSAIFENIE